MEYTISLPEMLEARERRAFRQHQLLLQYPVTMICFTMNIPGPLKNSPLIFQGFQLGIKSLNKQLAAHKIEILHFEEFHEATGNEAYYLIQKNPLEIKAITSSIEASCELGRLFDMDVLDENGVKVERTELGLTSRCCLICGKAGKECARSRSHTIEELQQKTTQILTSAINENDAKTVAQLAVRSLLYEVCTAPKPGLVDRFDSGSHQDMDIFTFIDSSCALFPYFEACVKLGRSTANLPASKTFSELRQIGKYAEADMFYTTKGINTHKGAVFSVGILCAALGRLPRTLWADTKAILGECALMVSGLIEADFNGLTEETAVTFGQKLYLYHKITGVRGQMEAGLPAVLHTGLPVLKNGLIQGLSINDAGCAALLALITDTTDTNIIARSNLKVWEETVSELKALLKKTPYPDKDVLNTLNLEFIKKNISPGGSADLLAICYLLYFLECEVL